MKWLKFRGQHINIGIIPANGYQFKTRIRFKPSDFMRQVSAFFGSRNAVGDATSSFLVFGLYNNDFINGIVNSNFRADYGGVGNNTSLKFDIESYHILKMIGFDVTLGKTTRIGDMVYTAPGNVTSARFPIFVGTINTGGVADNRPAYFDIGELVITNASNAVVFHGMPVAKGDTTYSTTPAPSNGFFDLVSKTYKVKTGGSGSIGFDDTDSELQAQTTVRKSDDYGLVIYTDEEVPKEFMNSKYRLLGADITSPTSQFKTFEVTLTGNNSEPNPPFPPYVEDWVFYDGQGTIEKEALIIDTGFTSGSLKIINIQYDEIVESNWQARAHQYQTGGSGNFNSYLTPTERHMPDYVNLERNKIIVTSSALQEIPAFPSQYGSATYNTLGMFNGGTLQSILFEDNGVRISLDDSGRLRFKTIVSYHWIQRAGTNNYRVRWKDWGWFQGVKMRVTVLNTPYKV